VRVELSSLSGRQRALGAVVDALAEDSAATQAAGRAAERVAERVREALEARPWLPEVEEL
jgi:hypothetical protein